MGNCNLALRVSFDELNIILYKLGISTNKASKSFGELTKVAEVYINS